MMHKDASYWDRGWRNVPDMTGARHLLDAPDLKEVLGSFGIPLPLKNVLDVGCGTGRASQLCDGYLGTDIAQSAIDYCAKKKIPAVLMTGPDDLPSGPFDVILCISVFTHVDRAERRSYLDAFAARVDVLVVDIIKGDGSGNVAAWTAVPEEFEQDMRDCGFEFASPADYRWDDHVHSYYVAS